MEDQQVPPSQPVYQAALQPQITPEQLAELKAQARERAIQQALVQQAQMTQPVQQPQVVYVRRNMTVAELVLILLLSCGIVTGIQWTWNIVSNLLPRIEIKAR